MEVASIVISSVALAASIVAPLIAAGALFINRITKSKCCGNSEIDLVEMTPQQIIEASKRNTESNLVKK